MAKEHLFDDLITAIHDSIIKANEMAEHQHLSLVEEYFDEENNPVCIELNLPFHNPANPDVPVYKSVNIPKLCLIPVSSLKMKEIEVNFEVEFTQLMNGGDKGDEDTKNKNSKSMFSFNSRAREGKSNMAKVNIKFEGGQPPEGIMRINDTLIRLVP